ncbi:MAG TPA: 16S rRNA (uracil(1498)-N(3))-methyltransferase, partial [Polyangiaceae bacterium]
DVTVHRRFLTFVEEVLVPRLLGEATRRLLIAHPGAPTAVEDVLEPGQRSAVTLAVGPDGGFTDREVASLVGAGGEVCHFGSAILRSEVAVVALLSQIALLRRQRKSWP